jgi:hypothetical protein
MMKCWLEEWLDFLFPEPVEQDIDGEPVEHDWYALPAQSDIPDFYRAVPLVAEAERVVRSRR